MNRGIPDPRELYVDQFCGLVWFLSVKEKEPHEVQAMKAQLWIPPKGVEVDERSPWHPSNQLKNLQAVKAGK